MVCRDFILPEPASYVFFYAIFNLRKLLYIINVNYRPMKEGVKHRKCFTPSFIVILFSAPHSGWPNAGAAAFLLLCEGNLGT